MTVKDLVDSLKQMDQDLIVQIETIKNGKQVKTSQGVMVETTITLKGWRLLPDEDFAALLKPNSDYVH